MKRFLTVIILIKLLYGVGLFLLFKNTPIQLYKQSFYSKESMTKGELIKKAQDDFIYRLTLGDGQYYIDIAERGYSFEGKKNYAFFPLWPLLIRSVGILTGSIELSAIILSFIFHAMAYCFLLLIAKKLSLDGYYESLFILFAFHGTVYCYLAYTESLFLMLSSGAIYFSMSGRSVWAALFGLLGGFTRPQGILLCIPLFLKALKDKKSIWVLASSLTPLLAFALFMAYVSWNTGSPLGLFEVQKDWGRSFELGEFFTSNLLAGTTLDWLTFLLVLLTLPTVFKEFPLSLSLYSLSMILLPMLTGSMMSFARFQSMSFIIFFALGSQLMKNKVYLYSLMGVLFWIQYEVILSTLAWRLVR